MSGGVPRGVGGRSALDRDSDELRPVTSLFADIVGSTSLAELLTTAEIKAVVGDCVDRMCEVVEEFGGRVRSYMGDGIAAFFGIDGTREDDSIRAAQAALEVKATIARFADEARQAWGVSDFNVRIGLNSGRVAVGLVGASDPQRVALGDSVNVAARLQAIARPGTVVVGGSCAGALEGRFTLTPLGALQLRGKTERVEAYELEDISNRSSTSFSSACLGRGVELDLIASLIDEVFQGRGEACFIVGEAGIGKSRLVAEAQARSSSEVLWLNGRCEPMDQRLPFEPFVEPIWSWLGLERSAPSIQARVRLTARGRGLLGERFVDVAPHLARLIGVELGGRVGRRFDGLPLESLMESLKGAYVEWLTALARRSPVVLVIDNFGSVSREGAELATRLVNALDEVPMLLLVTMRPEVLSPGWSVRAKALSEASHRCREIRLAPLSESDSSALVATIGAPDILDDRLVQLVVQRAEGNPLYLEELCAALSSDVSIGLPGPLETVLLSRIDALPAGARSVLQAASILGRTFYRGVLVNMRVTDALEESLTALLRADVIREHGRQPAGYTFRHGLVREAALSTLTPRRYRELNRIAADALQQWDCFDEAQHAEMLVGHLLACGVVEEEAEWLERLADRMALVFRFESARGLLERCMSELRGRCDLPGVARVGPKLAGVCESLGDLDAAIEVLNEAIAFIPDSSQRTGAELARARLLAEVGEVAAAESSLKRILEDNPTTEERISVQALRVEIALHAGNASAAKSCAADLMAASGSPPSIALAAASSIAGLAATEGRCEDATVWAEKALDLAVGIGKTTGVLTAQRRLGLVHLLSGEVRRAHEITEKVYREYLSLGVVPGQVEAGMNLLYTSELTGALRAGEDVATRLLRLDSGPLWSHLIGVNAAALFYQLDRLDDAEKLVADAIAYGGDLDIKALCSAHLTLATIAAARGRWTEAQSILRAALGALGSVAAPRELAALEVAYAEACVVLGWIQEGVHLAESAWERALQTDRVSRSCIRRIYGEVWGRVDVAKGAAMLEELIPSLVDMGLRLEEGRAVMALSRLRWERSLENARRAESVFRECDCQRGLAELRIVNESVLLDSRV